MKKYEISEMRKSDGKILDCHHFETTDELISYFMGFINGVICKDGYYYEILRWEDVVEERSE